MTMRPVYLQAVALVDRRDFVGPRGVETWNPDGADIAPDPRRFFPDQPRLGRLDLPSRFVVCAAGLLPAPTPDIPDATAVILGTTAGCLDADRTFAASVAERPSPATYARTLPTTPGAELAILRGYRGPDFAIIQNGIPGLLAMAAAVQEIASGACEAAIAGEYDALAGAGGAGSAVLCLLGSLPAGDGRSRPVTLARRAADGDGGPTGLETLVPRFLDSPAGAPFALEGTGSGSLIRLEFGPTATR
jgi:hypothetical protein